MLQPELILSFYISHCIGNHKPTGLFLINKKALFFLSEKQNCCFIHYNHDYAQSRVVSAQFQSKFR